MHQPLKICVLRYETGIRLRVLHALVCSVAIVTIHILNSNVTKATSASHHALYVQFHDLVVLKITGGFEYPHISMFELHYHHRDMRVNLFQLASVPVYHDNIWWVFHLFSLDQIGLNSIRIHTTGVLVSRE